jgi:hypothetical protein
VFLVLALALAPSASMICRASCGPVQPAAGSCHHSSDPGSPLVDGGDWCQDVVISSAAEVQPSASRRDLRSGTGAASLDGHLAVVTSSAGCGVARTASPGLFTSPPVSAPLRV